MSEQTLTEKWDETITDAEARTAQAERSAEAAQQILEDVKVCFGNAAGVRLLAFLGLSYCRPMDHETLIGKSGEDVRVALESHAAAARVVYCIRSALDGKIRV